MTYSWCVLVAICGVADAAPAKPVCAPALTDDQVKAIITKERGARKDLPPPFKQTTWTVRRDGCYYVVTEWPVPAVPDSGRIWKLNQYGAIVDLIIGNSLASPLQCPDKVYDQRELAAIVAKARAARSDLPPPLAKPRIAVSRARCTYLYFEYRQPEHRGDYQVFTIDPLGELMEFQISKPY